MINMAARWKIARLLFEIVSGIRAACGDGFLIGVRLSPERFGMRLAEALKVCQQLIDGGETDFGHIVVGLLQVAGRRRVPGQVFVGTLC